MKTVVGMFNTPSEAQRTLDELTRIGFGAKDISVVTNIAAQNALGPTFGLSALDVTDLGKIAACGPLADSLRQSNASGLTATLQYYGLSPKLAEHYALGVSHGETLEALTVEDRDADRVVAVMERHARIEREAETKEAKKAANPSGALASGAMAAAGASAARANKPPEAGHVFGKDEERRIPIIREELRVGKREVERGGVRVSVHVKETPITERINLREEHVEVERRAVDRAPLPGEDTFGGQEFEFDEYAEEPVISKEARVVEEVVIHKRVSGHDEVVTDTIRATEVDIDSMLDFNRADYQRHFASLNSGGNFDEYLPAYELGHKLRVTNARSWDDIEKTAQKSWESSRPGTWDRFKDTVRYAWTKAHLH